MLPTIPSVLNDAGFSVTSAIQSSIYIGAINFIGTALGIFLVDRTGRRLLLKLGTSGIFIAYCFLVAAYFAHLPPICMLIAIIIFTFCFVVGPGIVAWIIASELIPTATRGKGVAIVLFFNSLTGWIITTSFLDVIKHLGLGYTYCMFAIFALIYLVGVAKFLPETGQKSLEQIQKELSIFGAKTE